MSISIYTRILAGPKVQKTKHPKFQKNKNPKSDDLQKSKNPNFGDPYFFVLSTSALTTTIAANGVKVIMIVSSAFVAGGLGPRNIVGIVFVCLAIVAYGYFSYALKDGRLPQWLQAPLFSVGADAESGMFAKPSEATPLNVSDPKKAQVCCVIA